MLSNSIEKVKRIIEANKSDLFVAFIIFLVGMIGFGLGRLSVVWPEKEPITIENVLEKQYISVESEAKNTYPSKTTAAIANTIQGQLVGSKSGTAYHFPWCSGAQRIKEENKIWFTSKEEAEKKGYRPAGNCPGL